jgi:hypothetical protein
VAGPTHVEKKRQGKPLALELVAPTPDVARTLTVGHAFDPAEAEADRVADSVIARLRSGQDGEHEHTDRCEHGVQRAAAPARGAEVGMAGGDLSAGLAAEIESRRGRGSALPSGVRRRMESAFGGDLGDVSIHTDDKAAELSSAVSAKAFTTGKDIFFGAGQFDPSSPAGEHTLAHEIAHTRQQSSAVGRKAIHRKWNLKAKDLGLHKATGIRTIKSRPVWFIEDNDGDEIVVKADNQPFGLGEIVGTMHKKVSNIKSVNQRQLTSGDRLAVDNLIEIHGNISPDPNAGWVERGQYLKNDPDNWKNLPPADADPRQLAVDNALQLLNDKKRSVIAMSVAGGEGGDKVAEKNIGEKGGAFKSEMRTKLSDFDHLMDLGRLTAVDLFMGNQDRTVVANIGNWFYGKDNAITLIDQIDQGTGQAKNFNPAKTDYWSQTSGESLVRPDGIVKQMVDQFAQEMKKVGDAEATAWFKSKVEGQDYTHSQLFQEVVKRGMEEAKAKLLKIFATKRNIFSSNHKARKALKATAKKASKTDEGNQTEALAEDKPDYWTTLKQRAAWLKTG